MTLQTIPQVDLYPHNQRAYKAILEKWETSNKAAVVQPTGTGKSYIILQCLHDTTDSVVLAPSNYILDQLLEHSDGLPSTRLLTYAKLLRMSSIEIEQLNPSLIVMDEFHRCGADIWGKSVQALLNQFPTAYVLGTSATPIRYLDGERNMADELFEGNVASMLTLTDAIAQGILPTPKIVTALYTFDEEAEKTRNKIDKSSNSEESKAELTKQLEEAKRKLDKSKGIPRILKRHRVGAGKFIVFCKDKAHLHDLKPKVINWFKEATGRVVEDYSIFHDANDNDAQHKAFRDNRNVENVRLMFSIEMYNEGIHIEDVTGVVLLRPTTSPIIYFQQIGRALQSGNQNEPLIFDFVNNKDSVRAGDLDREMKESVERERARRQSAGEREILIPEFTVYGETVDALKMFADIEGRLIDNFNAGFEAFKAYLAEHGEYPRYDTRLGKWVNWIRASFKIKNSRLLTKDYIDQLNSIEFSWEPQDEEWESNFHKYAEIIGNGEPRVGTKIRSWANKQRHLFGIGKISQYKINKLNGISFAWSLHDNQWNFGYNALVKYKDQFGDCNVPYRFEIDGFNLGVWVRSRRTDFRVGRLSQDRIDQLNAIGFVWEANKESEDHK